NRPITLWMSHPGPGAPALYLLNAVDGGEDGGPWMNRTDVAAFFADKNVTVVLPVGGQSSFYADWMQPNNGRNYKWETFLTKELPPLLESQWRATDVRGMQGLSMGGTAAMFLAG
ncbi:alpha/beta hydrolase-fold protein, partial [Streptococcus agalactiae]